MPELQSILLKEILKIRIDTVWKMIRLSQLGYLPDVLEEGATGEFDNKGALFIPGGLLYSDSDGKLLGRKDSIYKDFSNKDEFITAVKQSMLYDNASLIFPNFIQMGINLPNEFLTKSAVKIASMKNVMFTRKSLLAAKGLPKIDSAIISKNYSPKYLTQPYGSRLKISSCVSVCKSEPHAFFLEALGYYSLRESDEFKYWESLGVSLKPIYDEKNELLSHPHIIVCHTSRYLNNSMTGLTRILGIGKIGEFAVITLEKHSVSLDKELKKLNKKAISQDDYMIRYEEYNIVCVIRMYESGTITNKTSPHVKDIEVISPEKSGVDIIDVNKVSMARYF